MGSRAGLDTPDVVVIGGGVSGAAASRLLASWGHLVLQVERDVARPALAESLPPSCIPLLETIGVRAAIDAAGFVRGGGNTVWWGGAPMRVEPFPDGRLGYQVLRERLEDVLGDCAEAAGVVRWRPATAVRVTPAGKGHDVELSLPAGRRTVRARWVLDCSGRAGVMARAHRVAPPDGVRTMALIDVWERVGGWGLPDDTHTLVESAAWGWGWSVPTSPERRYVTAMLDPGATPLGGEEGLAARYAALIGSLPGMAEVVRGARPGGTPWACEATPYHSTEVALPGALLVGDAASMIDPLSSFGVKKALASAWLAAVVVHTALVTGAHTELAMALYREREGAYVRSAARALGGLSREAGAGRALPFWLARSAPEGDAPEGDAVDAENPQEAGGGDFDSARIEALRRDPEVLAAFQLLRERATLRLAAAPEARRVLRAVVRGNVVVPEEHLLLRDFENGVRYLRSADLVALLEVAGRHDDVGAMYADYCRLLGPLPLPDFLGALSVLVGKGGVVVA